MIEKLGLISKVHTMFIVPLPIDDKLSFGVDEFSHRLDFV
jgi:hypothetical protein